MMSEEEVRRQAEYCEERVREFIERGEFDNWLTQCAKLFIWELVLFGSLNFRPHPIDRIPFTEKKAK